MPIYTFQCNKCEKIEDNVLPIRDMDRTFHCKCGGTLKRIIAVPPSVHLDMSFPGERMKKERK